MIYFNIPVNEPTYIYMYIYIYIIIIIIIISEFRHDQGNRRSAMLI